MSLLKSSLENQPYYNLESIFRAFKRKEMKASRRLAENDIISRGVTVKIQQVANSCNNVAPVTNLCLGRATTRSRSSQWSKKKFAVET